MATARGDTRRPAQRDPAQRAHLTGFDPANGTPFLAGAKAVITTVRPQVLIQTPLGDIEVELDAEKAPITKPTDFICLGDQPELDFGGKRNPDGQGFAAFGRVVKGMDVVRKIHQRPADGQNLTPAVLIQRVIRTE